MYPAKALKSAFLLHNLAHQSAHHIKAFWDFLQVHGQLKHAAARRLIAVMGSCLSALQVQPLLILFLHLLDFYRFEVQAQHSPLLSSLEQDYKTGK